MGVAITVVVATRDRRDALARTLARLAALPERPAVVVVDNGSSDGTVAMVHERYPEIRIAALGGNAGAAARTAGVRLAGTPIVAFADDDSWWETGALPRAQRLFDTCPRLALLAARVLVGEARRLDPVCTDMADSPLGRDADLPGPSVLGFVACGTVVRRDAFLAAGGFHPRFGVGGEEELLALDLRARGLGLAYVPDVVAIHEPSPARDPSRRRTVQARNALWVAWLRRRPAVAVRDTLAAARIALADPAVRRGLAEALRGLPWVLRERRVVPPDVEAAADALAA
jgi:GT2 family glycosyltransferase